MLKLPVRVRGRKKNRFGLVKNVDQGIDSVHPKAGQEMSDRPLGIQCSVPPVWGVPAVLWVLCSPGDTACSVVELVWYTSS